MNVVHLFFVCILVLFLRKTSTIHTLNFCSGMPLRKVHELTFLWFGLPGPLLTRKCLDLWHFSAPDFQGKPLLKKLPSSSSVMVHLAETWQPVGSKRPKAKLETEGSGFGFGFGCGTSGPF